MNTAEQKERQLIAIHRLTERGRRKSFGKRDSDDEIRSMTELSELDIRQVIDSGGWRRNDLENDRLLRKITTSRGTNAWRLTPEGKDAIRRILDRFGKRQDKEEAIETLSKFGIDSRAIWVLEQKKLSGAELERLLSRQGGTVTSDADWVPPDNLEVERKAIEFIVKREGKWQRARSPVQKGYDLEERDNSGNIVRWCEVKALTGSFENSQGIALSDSQFQMAVDKGEAYWLYIVENVGDANETRVLAIRNPASQVKRFVFRHSWRFAVTKVIEA